MRRECGAPEDVGPGRLGRKAEARSALTPFARGAYGDYRRREAQELVEALGGEVP